MALQPKWVWFFHRITKFFGFKNLYDARHSLGWRHSNDRTLPAEINNFSAVLNLFWESKKDFAWHQNWFHTFLAGFNCLEFVNWRSYNSGRHSSERISSRRIENSEQEFVLQYPCCCSFEIMASNESLQVTLSKSTVIHTIHICSRQ